MNCPKCNKDASNVKNAAKCAECKAYFHVTCCRIRSLAKLSSMSGSTLSSWKCDDCANETLSTTSVRSDNDDPKIYDILQSIQKEIASSQASNKSGFELINHNLASMQQTIEDLNKKLSSVETVNAELKAECGKLSVENIKLNDRIWDLEKQVEDLQQYSRNRNVEIKGVPVTPNENVYNILEAIAKAMGVRYDRSGISIAHRLPAPREKNHFPPSIIAQFVSRSTRAEWIAAARAKKLQTTDLAPSLRPSPVFVMEHLTRQNKQLLLHAKSHVRSGHLAFSWTRDGKIFVRKTPDSAVRRVWSPTDVDNIAQPRNSGGGSGDGGNIGGGGRGGGAQENPITDARTGTPSGKRL